ncbi:MAG: DEAD/DEAH box helicase family protein [Acidobacteriota bacterium]
MLRLEFDRGTLLVRGDVDALPDDVVLPGCVYDRRVRLFRAPAWRYREILTLLHRAEVEHENDAGGFESLDLRAREVREPFPYQAEAVDTWWRRGRRGVVVLPTGAGKTFVAQMIAERLGRTMLVVTPTIDLMQQWYGVLKTAFDVPVGLVGGGYYDVEPITVTTYDSAYIHMERLGNRFALLVFDECHHLPGPTYATAAEMSIAPFRLGLTATPEREDGGEKKLDRLIGPIVYRREIGELAGEFLAEYETVELRVRLSEEERGAYLREREIYRSFLHEEGLYLGTPQGWQRFLQATSRSERGRRAFLAFRAQKTIAQASDAKLRLLETLLARHRRDRVLIFTSDNETVYRISRRFLIPAITHQTKVKERHRALKAFNDGTYPFPVTSRVLNEGVDVPAASVGVVLSGSGSVREHVQRLGRILRRAKDKRAVLYEVVASDTGEEFTSERRRQHGAYRRGQEDPQSQSAPQGTGGAPAEGGD